MKKATEFLNNIKERFTNPLIFSFLCSWSVFNWEIVISLFRYDPNQIVNEGSRSLYQFISTKLDRPHSFCYPLLFAMSYTILSPIVRNLIQALHAWAFQWGNKWSLKLAESGKIGIEKYIQLREDWKKRTVLLEKVIADENKYKQDYDKMNTELLETKVKLNEVQQKEIEYSTFIQHLYDIRILDGSWVNSYETSTKEKGTEDILIQNGQYYLLDLYGDKKILADIRNFTYDNKNQSVFFIKELVPSISKTREQDKYSFNRLTFENRDLLVGTENGTTKIEYRRK